MSKIQLNFFSTIIIKIAIEGLISFQPVFVCKKLR